MSTETHTHTSKEHQHGSMTSYVVGFVLSLVFTIIPYLLVVNKTFSGDSLTAAILVFAIIQMFIQIFFFLHLGRGPKPLYNVFFFVITAFLIAVVVVASLFIMANLYRNMSPEELTRKLAQKEGIAQVGGQETGACQGNRDNHIVVIGEERKVLPAVTNARLCDTITFINDDQITRELVFGTYSKEVSYGGEDKVVLDDGRPETITLNELGTFVFYDRLNKNIIGSFTVSN